MKNELVREWIRKGEEDYEIVLVLLAKKSKKFYNAICFHSQQATEKYLKAFLAQHQIDFPKTHDLTVLIKLCLKQDPSFELIVDLVRRLNSFSVDLRYPGDNATRIDAKHAAFNLKEIHCFFQTKLGLSHSK